MRSINKKCKSTVAKAHGFSLIEVLIALIVMSVGMLGIAGLYVHGIQAGRTSLFRHHAITLAGDVADRIRSNPTAGIAYEGTGADAGCVGGSEDCSPAEMASTDVFLWALQADNTLPDGKITVDYSDGTQPSMSIYEVKVAWSEAGTTPDYSIQFPVFEPGT